VWTFLGDVLSDHGPSALLAVLLSMAVLYIGQMKWNLLTDELDDQHSTDDTLREHINTELDELRDDMHSMETNVIEEVRRVEQESKARDKRIDTDAISRTETLNSRMAHLEEEQKRQRKEMREGFRDLKEHVTGVVHPLQEQISLAMKALLQRRNDD
jgi:hypothetical protein